MRSITKVTLAVAASGYFSCALAQQQQQQQQQQSPFRFDSIPGIAAEPHVQIDLGPALLGFAAEAARQSDPSAADMIAGLRGVSVRVYEELADAAAVQSFVDQTSQSLEQSGWERVVFVQDGTDKVRVHARVENEQIVGMTVMVLDPSEAVFINIDGQIDPAQLGRVAAGMGFGDVLGAIMGAAQAAPLPAPQSQAPANPAPAPENPAPTPTNPTPTNPTPTNPTPTNP
ncbi:MAG TPA: DUF4252 domain-containing protein [Gammaproteobacteria bacterium]